jgi:hypothetical protein
MPGIGSARVLSKLRPISSMPDDIMRMCRIVISLTPLVRDHITVLRELVKNSILQ